MSVSYKRWDMNDSFPVWLIHKIWAGGHAARALFFTREQGLLWAKYHGGWGPKKQAILQAFTPLWAEWTQRQTWYTVRHLEIAGTAFDFLDSILLSALYVNELIYHLLRPQDPHPDLYDAYVVTLQQLSLVTSQIELERVLRRFEWMLLSAIGYAVSLTHEAHHHTPILADHYYHFQPGLGFIPARNGWLGMNILALAQDDLSESSVLKTAKHLMRQALQHALDGKKIMSRDLFYK